MRGLFLVLVVLFSFTQAEAWAASPGPAPLSESQFLLGRFTLDRHLAGFEKPLTSGGWFFAGGTRGLVWATQKPVENVTVVKGAALRQIDASGNVVSHNDGGAEMAGVVGALSGVLAGDFTSLEETFSVERQEHGEQWTAVLRPKNHNVAVQLTEIRASGADFVSEVVVRKGGGDFDVIQLEDHRVGSGALPRQVTPYLD